MNYTTELKNLTSNVMYIDYETLARMLSAKFFLPMIADNGTFSTVQGCFRTPDRKQGMMNINEFYLASCTHDIQVWIERDNIHETMPLGLMLERLGVSTSWLQ